MAVGCGHVGDSRYFVPAPKDIRIKIGLMDRQIYLIVFLAVTASSPTISAQPDASRPSLVIMPSSGIQASGPQGGPFSPAVVQYLVRATSGTIRFVIAPPFWLTADPRLGTAGAEGVMITLTINQRALRLPPGTYGPRTTFTNLTSGQGSTTRPASLIVHDPPPTAIFWTKAADICRMTVRSDYAHADRPPSSYGTPS